VGAMFLQQQPGRAGLVRYLGVKGGSLAFLDLCTGETHYYPFLSWAGLIRSMTVHEIVAMRKGGRHERG
jgi:hypothetical protein